MTSSSLVAHGSYTGAAIAEIVGDVARLRITLFRAYPYLYDGTEAYERTYLQGLVDNPRSLVLVARAGGRIVAAATALPLASEADILANAGPQFAAHGLDVATFYYYSEILVEPAFRGAGIAKEFYRRRDTHARALGFANVCFAAIEHPPGAVVRPAEYFDPAPLWRSMGFVRRPDIAFTYHWPTLTAAGTEDRSHRLVVWTRPLDPVRATAPAS